MIKIRIAILLLAVSEILPGCDQQPKGPGGEVWKEEVRLMIGDLLIVDRRNVWGESGDLSQGHGPLTKSEISFDYKGKHYKWSQRGLAPTALQEDSQGRMYIVSIIPYCWAWREWGRPNSYYVVHRFENGKWNRVDIASVDPATFFNLAGESREPHSSQPRDYVPESATKYGMLMAVKNKTKMIVSDAKTMCQ